MEFFETIIGQYLVQSVFHAALVALMVESLIRMWRYKGPSLRLPFHLLTLLLPIATFPLYQTLYPERGSAAFRESLAIIDLNAWLRLPLGQGLYLWHLFALALAAATLSFLVQEAAPLVRGRWGVHPATLVSAPAQASKLDSALAKLRQKAGGPLPPTMLTAGREPMAFSFGLLQPRVVISPPMVAMLDEEELVAVLAHELAHIRRGDSLWGWALMGIRIFAFYNPVAILAWRRIIVENEKACDDLAVSFTGKPLALASGLVKVLKAREAKMGPASRWPFGIFPTVGLNRHANKLLIAARTKRLLAPPSNRQNTLAFGRLALTTLAIMGLLFFVV